MHTTQELLILATVSHQNIKKQKLKMTDIFREAKNELSSLIQEYGASVTEPDTWPESVGYAPWIEEVWMNYLSNAIKYGGIPPVIKVGAEPISDNKVKFWVKDNGTGLTPENQKKLFKKHVRLNPEKAEGYGLGLSIVKRIVEKLDGTVGVESSGIQGEGSRFYFILPAS